MNYDLTYTFIFKSNFYAILPVLVMQLELSINYIDFIIAFPNGIIDRHSIFIKQLFIIMWVSTLFLRF